MPERIARGYVWGMLRATQYLHSRGLCHRDISLENAMLGSPLPPPSAAAHADSGAGAAAAAAAASAAAPSSSSDLVVKLIDFGLTKQLPPAGALLLADGQGASAGGAVGGEERRRLASPLPSPPRPPAAAAVGKPKYMAPETYGLRPYDGRAIDAWCVGISAFILIFGVYPYTTPSPELCK